MVVGSRQRRFVTASSETGTTGETLLDASEYIDELIGWYQRPIEANEIPEDAEPIDDDDEDGRGTVVTEKVTCGDESCKCMTDGEKHGPYLYRYFRREGKLTSEYIGKP